MKSGDVGRVAAAIAEYDGKHSDSLAAVAASVDPSREVLAALGDFVGGADRNAQSAASWLLRRYVEAGAVLSPQESEQVLATLIECEHWQTRLHILQMMGHVTLPASRVERLWRALDEYRQDANKFLRAWSYFGAAVVADQYPRYRDRALGWLAAAERDEAASVRARVRRIRKAFAWVR